MTTLEVEVQRLFDFMFPHPERYPGCIPDYIIRVKEHIRTHSKVLLSILDAPSIVQLCVILNNYLLPKELDWCSKSLEGLPGAYGEGIIQDGVFLREAKIEMLSCLIDIPCKKKKIRPLFKYQVV